MIDLTNMKLKRFLQVFGAIAVFFTFLPYIPIDYWWIRVFDFPHFQLTLLTLIALLAYFIRFDIKSRNDYLFVVVLISCFLFQSSKIYPYTQLAAYEVKNSTESNPNKTLKIFTANVLQKNEHTQKLLAEIKRYDADIMLFTETNQRWKGVILKTINTDYKYREEIPLDNTYGMLLYSKFPLINSQVKFIVDDSIPSIHALVKLPSGDTVQIFGIHPTPPVPTHNMSSTDRDAEMMKIALKSLDAKYPVIVVGDFNDVAWSESTSLFQKVSGLLDIRKGRGFFNTYNADHFIFRWPLDHIFVSEHFRVITVERGKDIDSDHFPIFVNLSFEPDRATEQIANPPTKEQLKSAREQIKDEKEQEE